jgi:hypothetical protein
MEKAITNLLKLQNQLRICHWQTESYAEHKALSNAYEDLDGQIDELVEVYQGKRGRIKYDSPLALNLVNYDEVSLMDLLDAIVEYLITGFEVNLDSVGDSDIKNIRDSILATINRLRYLLTLK